MEEEKEDRQISDSKKNKLPLLITIGVVIVVLLAGGFYLISNRKNRLQGITDENTSQKVSLTPSSDADEIVGEEEVKEMVIEGDEYEFLPPSITLSQGEKIRLTFKNVGSVPHNFVIDELDVTTKIIPGGASEVVKFTASKSGTFSFYCSVGNHKELGMEGKLDVE